MTSEPLPARLPGDCDVWRQEVLNVGYRPPTMKKLVDLTLTLVSALLVFGISRSAEALQPAALPAAIAAPRDVNYPGELQLTIDATDLDRHIFRGREVIPVAAPGPMTLLFARWIPGHHSPTGSLDQFAGLVITASGQRVKWTRDTIELAAFHVTVPPGAPQLELEFQFLSPTRGREGRIVMTPDMLNLQWESMLLYPAGHYASRITIASGVKLPPGWGLGTSLETLATTDGVVRFKPVSLETLVDSPIFAGRYFRQFDLDPGAAVPVRLNVVADKASLLEAKPEHVAIHRALVQQAYRLFGSHHYDHYDFLLALTENLDGIGLEHHRSSENSMPPRYFTDWDNSFVGRDLLAHEFTHSWNGKFRRPADLWTPNYNVPMRDSLLWVYEGQTEYWGYVLAGRSGLHTRQQTMDAIAEIAASYDHDPGRAWRAMQDTTNDPPMASRRPLPWRSWQRSEDYYSEGQLIWLDADTLIREQTKGAKSLDDFARAFLGIADGTVAPLTYTFADVVRTLNGVLPYDWAAFLRGRLDGHGPGAPLDGLRRGGYRLVYTETPSEFSKGLETDGRITGLSYSLGLSVDKDGMLTEVRWEGPAFKAGLIAGTQLVAVSAVAYDAELLKAAIAAAAKPGAGAIELLVKNGDRYRTVAVDYHGGLRYPHLERLPDVPDLLDAIMTARK